MIFELNDERDEAASEPPRVFTRLIVAPPALPWEQTRVAGLDARMNAPVASPDIVQLVRRLDSWRPGKPGRFLAAYARGADVGEGLTSDCQVDGRTVSISFIPAARRQAELRQTTLLVGLACATVVALAGGVAAAIAGRMTAEDALTQAEDAAARQARLAAQQALLQAQDRALQGVDGERRRIEAVTHDLAWASRARASDAVIEGFHWRPDYFAVEVRGEQSPFAATGDRQVNRAGKPVRRGVWLWGVSPEARGAGGLAQ